MRNWDDQKYGGKSWFKGHAMYDSPDDCVNACDKCLQESVARGSAEYCVIIMLRVLTARGVGVGLGFRVVSLPSISLSSKANVTWINNIKFSLFIWRPLNA